MPINVRELDDRQMFEQALAENIKRRNLDPMEQASAMKRYMDLLDQGRKRTNLTKKVEVFEQAVKLQPSRPEAYYYLMVHYCYTDPADQQQAKRRRVGAQ